MSLYRAKTILFVLAITVTHLSASAPGYSPSKRIIKASSYIDPQQPGVGIQKAIEEAAAAGGGVVVLPKGRFAMNRFIRLRSNVTLRGQGEKTVLAVNNKMKWRSVASVKNSDASATVVVKGDISALKSGMTVMFCSHGGIRYGGVLSMNVLKPCTVTSVSGQTVTLDKPVTTRSNHPMLIWGVSTLALEAGKKKATSLRVANPGYFRPGYGFFVIGKGRDMHGCHFNIVKSIKGNTLEFERPLTVSFSQGTVVRHIHNMILADHEQNFGIENLHIEGWKGDVRPAGYFYTGAINILSSKNFVIRGVQVTSWSSDGFSLQGNQNGLVQDCVATDCHGTGFHPGTTTNRMSFVNVKSTKNAGGGLKFCWHNMNVVIRGCEFRDNGSSGITEMGHPGERNALIENCIIAGNGKCGIDINGGGKESNSIIRNNVIENNSRRRPGRFPGIGITALGEDAMGYTIKNNTIRDTQKTPTQQVGILEQHCPRAGKNHRADKNRIIGNTFSGHTQADVVIVGKDTSVEQGKGVKVIRK